MQEVELLNKVQVVAELNLVEMQSHKMQGVLEVQGTILLLELVNQRVVVERQVLLVEIDQQDLVEVLVDQRVVQPGHSIPGILQVEQVLVLQVVLQIVEVFLGIVE
jgi:hypothetical protein